MSKPIKEIPEGSPLSYASTKGLQMTEHNWLNNPLTKIEKIQEYNRWLQIQKAKAFIEKLRSK